MTAAGASPVLLSELDTLPNHAGLARLNFCRGHRDPQQDWPRRVSDVIHLPTSPDDQIEWIWLRGGEQFVVRYPGQTMTGRPSRRVFFGGTDEMPFLVELNSPAYYALVNDGEETFYEELKPPLIRQLEVEGGLAGTRRQGDIFAFPAESQIWDLAKAWFDGGDEISLTRVTEWSLFYTRHLLTGQVLRYKPEGSRFTHRAALTVASGTIEAPDHAPLILREPHYLAQTAHLADPPRAD